MSYLVSGRFWIGLAISLVCLGLAVRNVPLDDLSRYATGARYIWLVPAIAFQLLAIVARARRWVVLLEREDRLADSFWAQGVGYLFTNLFPFRLGEPARVIGMSERCRLPVAQVAASAIVERLLDVATIVFVLILVLPWMRVPSLVIQAGTSFGALVLVALGAMLLVARSGQRGEKVLQSVTRYATFLPAEGIAARWRELVDGLLPLTRWQVATEAVCWSVVSWALSIAMYWCVLLSFRSDAALVEAAFMVVALSLAVTVPSSPGFVGVFQLVGQQALVLPFGTRYDLASALAITLTAHVTYYVLTSVLGVIGLWHLGQSFANLGRLAVVAPPASDAARRKVAS